MLMRRAASFLGITMRHSRADIAEATAALRRMQARGVGWTAAALWLGARFRRPAPIGNQRLKAAYERIDGDPIRAWLN